MSAHAFPFQKGAPFVTLTLAPPGFAPQPSLTTRETLRVDTGFSDYLQLDWDTFTALRLDRFVQRQVVSRLADGSTITERLSLVRVLIPECGIDRNVRCISNPGYGKDLMLVDNRFLEYCHAVIDYPQRQTALSS